MESSPLVSVVLPVYNGADYLEEAVRSVLGQTYRNIELLVWDDDSSDETAAVVRRFDDPRLKYHKNASRLGQFGNFNACISAARGAYVHLFAYDDVMEPEAVRVQLSRLEGDPSAGFAYCGIKTIDERGRVTGDSSADRTPGVIDRHLYLYIASHYGSLPPAISTVFARTETLRSVGGFDASFRVAGDLELWNRIADRHRILYTRDPLVRVRAHGGQTTNQSMTGYHYICEERLIWKWFAERIEPVAFARVERFRLRTRGVNLFEWALRKLVKGGIREFTDAWRELVAGYPAAKLVFYWVATLGNRFFKPKPMPLEEFRLL